MNPITCLHPIHPSSPLTLSQSEANIVSEMTDEKPELTLRLSSGKHHHNILPGHCQSHTTTNIGHQDMVLPEMSTSLDFLNFHCFLEAQKY